MLDFPAFLVQMLWPEKCKIIREIPVDLLGNSSFIKQLGYVETKIPWELSDDVLHIPIACVLVKLSPFKIYAWVILMTTHFLKPKIRVSAWIFWNFPSQVKIRYLRQHLRFHSENDLILKLVDDFLVSRYASLTTISSHFEWFVTLQNLNQFQKN